LPQCTSFPWGAISALAMAPATNTVKVKKSVADMVRWLNTEAKLASEVRLSAVARPLAALDEDTALEVLNALLEQEEPITDPTTWVSEAAKAILADSSGDLANRGEEEPRPPPEPKAWSAPKTIVKLPAATIEQVKRLAKAQVLQAEMPLSEVAESLALVSREGQEQILGSLEARAAEIANPVGYVCNACVKKANHSKGKGAGKGKGKGIAEGKPPLTASEKKILRTINFINGTMQLEQPISYRRCKESLDLVDEKSQLRILNRLKEKLDGGTEITSPTTWIKTACLRSQERYENFVRERKQEKQQAQEQSKWQESNEEPKPKRNKWTASEKAAAEVEWWDEGEGEAKISVGDNEDSKQGVSQHNSNEDEEEWGEWTA